MTNTRCLPKCFFALIAVLFCAGSVLLADDVPERTSFGAFDFAIPSGWTNTKPDREKTAAMLLLNGTAANNADAMVKVDVGKPAAPTANALAKVLAGKDGKVYPDSVLVDGTDGIKVETTSTDMSRPKFAIVIFRDEKVYLLMAAEKQGSHVSDALDQIVKTWKWSKAK